MPLDSLIALLDELGALRKVIQGHSLDRMPDDYQCR